MSFKPQVRTGNDPKFYSNALAFATQSEAEDNARDLMCRWFAVVDCRAVESTDPVTHQWTADGKLVSLQTGIGIKPAERVIV